VPFTVAPRGTTLHLTGEANCSYKKDAARAMPLYDWDETKRRRNIAEHRVDFTAAENFDWESALTGVDHREDYGELREIAIGFIGVRLHVMVFTRRGDATRVISLRKADAKDVRMYAENFK
jgi:uncharacterized protein